MKISLWDVNKGQLDADLALKNNFAAATDPGVGDDSADGYQEGSVWVNTTANRAFTCVDATEGAAIWDLQGISGISPTELGYLDGTTPGVVTASKAAVYSSTSLMALLSGAIAATGTNQATAAPLTKQMNAITGADGTVGVALPAATVDQPVLVINTNASFGLPVFPVAAGNDQINAAGVNASVTLGPGRSAWFVPTSATQWYVDTVALNTLTPANAALVALGVAGGYKIARGVTAVTGTQDVNTGLATVVAIVASASDDPDGTNLAAVSAVITGAAGHATLKAWKITAAGNAALIAATIAKNVSWIAIGT